MTSRLRQCDIDRIASAIECCPQVVERCTCAELADGSETRVIRREAVNPNDLTTVQAIYLSWPGLVDITADVVTEVDCCAQTADTDGVAVDEANAAAATVRAESVRQIEVDA